MRSDLEARSRSGRIKREAIKQVQFTASGTPHEAAACVDDRTWGASCQQRKIPAAQALRLPADADLLQLAMLRVNPATALLLLRNYGSSADRRLARAAMTPSRSRPFGLNRRVFG